MIGRGLALTLGLALAATASLAPPAPLTKLTFATNWKAQAEHGGFYQAVATGLYRKRGLDVTIRMGGPQVNNPQLLAAGAIDFNMGATSFDALNYARNDIPMVAVAAMFQKDPQVLIAHAGQGHDSLAAMKGKPILVSPGARTTYWAFLRAKFGFTDTQIRPYVFSLAPFLADRSAIQQGYITSEPYALEKVGAKLVVHLLADHGYDPYSTTIETSWKRVREQPHVVQAFVDASIEGWYRYLHGDPGPANALIKRHNPDMTDDQIAYSRDALIRHGIVDSGDAKRFGIGAMTDDRWQSFAAAMKALGLYPARLDVRKAYTLQFVNRRVGMPRGRS